MPPTLYYLSTRVILSNNIPFDILPAQLQLQLQFRDVDTCCTALDCLAASTVGHLECFKYAYERGSDFDEGVYSEAACGGHLDILKYACSTRKHNLISSWAMAEAEEGDHSGCSDFLKKEVASGRLRVIEPADG